MSGHIKVECPLIKKRENEDKWKRAMATMKWSDDEELGSEEEVKPKEVANFCLMAHDKENKVFTSYSS